MLLTLAGRVAGRTTAGLTAGLALFAAVLGCRTAPDPDPQPTAITADTGPTCEGSPLPEGPHHWWSGGLTTLGYDQDPDYCELEYVYPGCLLDVPGAPADGSCPNLSEFVALTEWFAHHAVGIDLVRCEPPYGSVVATSTLPDGGWIRRTFYPNERFVGYEIQQAEATWCCEGQKVSHLRGGQTPACNPYSYNAVPMTPEDF